MTKIKLHVSPFRLRVHHLAIRSGCVAVYRPSRKRGLSICWGGVKRACSRLDAECGDIPDTSIYNYGPLMVRSGSWF